jgi:hypothetical protein
MSLGENVHFQKWAFSACFQAENNPFKNSGTGILERSPNTGSLHTEYIFCAFSFGGGGHQARELETIRKRTINEIKKIFVFKLQLICTHPLKLSILLMLYLCRILNPVFFFKYCNTSGNNWLPPFPRAEISAIRIHQLCNISTAIYLAQSASRQCGIQQRFRRASLFDSSPNKEFPHHL